MATKTTPAESMSEERLKAFKDIMARFQPVTLVSAAAFAPYYAAFARTRICPRYFQSPTFLSYEGRVYYWAIIEDCLVIIKKRVTMGTAMIYLVLPPMHLTGDVAAEKRVLEGLATFYIRAKLSKEDLSLYGYTSADVDLDKNNTEFIYQAGNPIEPGKHGRHGRVMLNQYERLLQAGELEQLEYYKGGPARPSIAALNQMLFLARRWELERRIGGQVKLAQCIAQAIMGHTESGRLLAIGHGAHLIGYSYTERVAPGRGIIAARLRNYEDKTLSDPTLLMHALDRAYYSSNGDAKFLLNIGSWQSGKNFKGLQAAKEKLKPVARLQIYTTRVEGRITIGDYRSIQPPKIEKERARMRRL